MGQKQENARHDIQHKIATYRGAAHAKQVEQQIKRQHEKDDLQHIQAQRDHGIAMHFAHIAHDAVVNQLENRQKRGKAPAIPWALLEHKNRLHQTGPGQAWLAHYGQAQHKRAQVNLQLSLVEFVPAC